MGPVRKARWWVLVVVLVAGLPALIAVGCGTGGDTTTTALPTTTLLPSTTTTAPVTTSVSSTESSTTTTSSGATTTTEALSSAEIRLADGTIKGMGFIDKVLEKGGKRYLSIDYAEMLTGEAARLAAIQDGVIPADGSLDNDYYIRNQNPKKREFSISGSVVITTATRPGGLDEPATWEALLSFWGPAPPDGTAHLHEMPWWIIRRGTEVINIAEQYIP